MTIDDRLRVSGTVNLILCDKKKLTLKAGITVLDGDTLQIFGQSEDSGTIYSHPKDGDGALEDHAVIGGTEDNPNAGNIIIHGGKLDLDSPTDLFLDFDNDAACLGGGPEGSPKSIQIFGGIVNCDNAGAGGAAIGGGEYGAPDSGGGILIYGGEVNAEAHSSDGAAIGGGYDSPHASGTIRIYGGNITAKHCHGAGIGSGAKTDSNNIVITGGKITTSETAALAGGAGIGSGKGGRAHGISISNAVIVSTTTYGAAIGSGEDGPANSIHISKSDITATAKAGGAGIGSGDDGDCEEIVLENSIIKANSKNHKDADQWIKALSTMAGSTSIKNTGYATEARSLGGVDYARAAIAALGAIIYFSSTSSSGAAIGGGNGGNAKSITIKGCDVNVKSGNYSAAIGSGDEAKGSTSITIENSKVRTKTDNTIPDGEEMSSGTDAAAIGGGNEGDVDKIRIVNSDINVKSEGFAAAVGSGDAGSFNSIEIIDCENFKATSGSYGAAIGSGDEAKKCGTITITNSNVIAKAGTDAAAIGTGNETDQSATINITDSTVEAYGGRYAAGIGGGDNVSGGTINITNSTIKEAKSETDGAGIGGGESGNGGTINITDSNVTAHGGGYAAGIGGGDAGDGGNITISGSTVKAYGGTDAAGIGGGEDGNGGNITIKNYSDVYAEGKEYGAGIGGGEDSNGEYCSIVGNSTVEAVSGGKGNVQSIGHGDCGWYVSSYTGGTLSLGKVLIVKGGSDKNNTTVYKGSKRWEGVWNNPYAYIKSCSHQNTEWRYYDNMDHVLYCFDCNMNINSQRHKWENNVCTVCGGVAETINLTLREKNNNGVIIRTLDIPKSWTYHLPEPENVPDGYEFVAWYIYSETNQPHYFFLAGDGYSADEAITMEALYMPVAETTYIDKNGVENTVKARQLSNGQFPLFEGWYVVSENIDLRKNDYNLQIAGNVHLIIPDGKTFRFDNDTYDPDAFYTMYDPTLTVYGQSEQTGILDFGAYNEVYLAKVNQYGANIIFSGEDNISYFGDSVITAGSLKTNNGCFTQLTICGGNVEIGNLHSDSQPVFGWRKLTDSIKVKSVESSSPAKIVDGQSFKDEYGNLYTGTLTNEQWNTAIGKTLTPYIEHDYAAPEWKWDNEYRAATAVFKCKDCSDVQKIKAKVSCEDSGKNRISTARCIFYSDEYTTTLTKQIIFDVTAASASHGKITVNKTAAREGDNIKLDITPDNGYAVSKLFYTDSDGNKTVISGSAFTLPESDVTVTAEFAPLKQVEYIDENGNTQTAEAIPVTNDTTELIEGWYYVEGSVVLQSDTPIYGDVKLIMCDGASMNLDEYSELGIDSATEETSLSVYCAPGKNIGELNPGYINVETLNMIGGRVSASRIVQVYDDLNVKGGSLSGSDFRINGNINVSGGDFTNNNLWNWFFLCKGDMNITGGNVSLKDLTINGNTNISDGSVDIDGNILSFKDIRITGGNVAVKGKTGTFESITLGWTNLSDSIYSGSYSGSDSINYSGSIIKIADGQELTDGSTVYSGTYGKDQIGIFAGKALIPNFIQHVDRSEPYINNKGEYITGTLEHYATGNNKFAVNEDGSVGEKLDSVELSYFDFALLSDGTYQIKCYTGPMDDLTELEMPKTFKGKAVTVIGEKDETFMKGTGTQTSFTLILNENIAVIQGNAFFLSMLTSVKGNTSGLNQIKDKPFFWTNLADDSSIEIRLNYPGNVTVDSNAFCYENVTVRLKHATTLSSEGGASSIKYVITDDAHTYEDPVWTWAVDCSSAAAKFTCSDLRCKHEETVNATVNTAIDGNMTEYTATVKLNGKTYTDTKKIVHYSVTVANSINGTVTANKNTAINGETVKLTVTPDDNYKIKSVTVTDSEGKAVSVDNNYSFVMPASDVTVKAEFTVITYNISVGGIGITAKNCSDILGDGTASYNYGTNTLTLTNANIEVKNGNGIRYNESSKRPFTIVLNGANRIAEVKDNGSGTCYGMALYAAAPGFIISGSGSLDIEMDSDSPRCGIHVRKALTVSGVKINVNVTGSENANGVELVYSDSVLNLENGARMNIHTGGIALQSNRNVRNLSVSGDCIFEAVSDTQAVNGNINLTEGHPTVKVSENLSKSGSYNWDEKTSLTSYKYISMRGINVPCIVKWMIDDEIIETDTVHYGEIPQYSGSTPKKKADTLYTYTFKGWTPEITAAEGDVTYMAVFESKEKEYHDGYNLTITDSIDVNIYLDIQSYFGGEDFSDQARAVLTYIDCNSQKPRFITDTIYLNKTEFQNGMFIKTITPAFAQIGENIKVQLYGNDGELMTLANGKTEYNISVANYCNSIKAPELYGENVARIAQSVLNYGKAASDYFSYKGAAIDGAETAEPVDYNAIPVLNQFTAGSTIENMGSSAFRAISCTELKLYITGDASGVTITKATLAGTGNIKKDCKIEKGSDGRYFVRVSNLYAYELDKEITLTFSDGSVKHFSVFDYIRSILKNSTSETSKRMVSALYQYNRAVADFG